MSDFDWTDDDCIAVHDQGAIAVYQNPRGHLVIRQRDVYCYDRDDWIEIAPENVLAVVQAMLLEAGFEVVDKRAKRKPKDPTAAERQRRYRERKRNERHTHNGNGVAHNGDALPLMTPGV